MAEILALEALFDAVKARFTAEGPTAANVFGWRQPAQLPVGARIVWIPGDPAGNAGAALPPRGPGGNPRSLATYEEQFTVEISSSDPTAPEDERKQYHAVRLLRDAWHRAVYLAARGTFQIRSETWLIDRKERRHGAVLRIVVELQGMVPDAVQATAPVDTGAAIASSSLDTTENVVVAGPEAPEEPPPEEPPPEEPPP